MPVSRDSDRPIKEIRRGFLATLPLAPGVVAFGLLYGAMARRVGFSPWEAWAMSLIVHAGSAQFAVLQGWGSSRADAAILTALVVNLRHLLLGHHASSGQDLFEHHRAASSLPHLATGELPPGPSAYLSPVSGVRLQGCHPKY